MAKGGIRKTHSQFINELKDRNPRVFNDFVIIDKYVGALDKIRLKGKYGIVLSTPTSLLQGSYPTIQSALDKNHYFINQVIETHGYNYNYSEVDYVGARKKIKIICEIHGAFHQVANDHLCGSGCPQCKYASHGIGLRKDKEYFIERSIKTHGEKYDYSLVNYTTNNSLVNIICPIHGLFSQKSGNHMRGQGCPMCSSVHYDIYSAVKYKNDYLKNKGKLYIIKIESHKEYFYKVGITVKPVKERFKLLKKYGYRYELIGYIQDNMYNIVILEDYIHNTLSNYSYLPKHKFSGYTECYSYIDDNIIEFCYSNLRNRIAKLEKEV